MGGTGRRKVKRWGVVETYSGFSVATRFIFAGMFFGGVALCISLVMTDIGVGLTEPRWLTQFDRDWLKDHAFIPNILAGFTGFLVGVPVAAVVLAAFTTQREEKLALDRVNQLSKAAWFAFRNAVYDFCSEDRIQALEEDVPSIKQWHDDAFKVLQEYINLTRIYQNVPPNLDDLLALKADVLRSLLTEYDFSANGIPLGNKLRIDPDWIGMAWAGVVGAWNVLDQYVRIRRLELNLD